MLIVWLKNERETEKVIRMEKKGTTNLSLEEGEEVREVMFMKFDMPLIKARPPRILLHTHLFSSPVPRSAPHSRGGDKTEFYVHRTRIRQMQETSLALSFRKLCSLT